MLTGADRRLLPALCAILLAALAGCGGGASGHTGGGGGGGGGAQAITVTFSNAITQVTAGDSATTLQVQVANDSANAGVTWALMAGDGPCSPVCGTLQPSASPSLSAVYTPPASFPASPNEAPEVVATSITDKSKSATDSFSISPSTANNCPAQGNEAAMGPGGSPWAYMFSGYNAITPAVSAGSLILDGSGGMQSGVFDLTVDGFAPQVNASIFQDSSFYSVNSAGQGCLQLTFAGDFGGTHIFHFTLSAFANGVAAAGRMVEFDAMTSAGEEDVGILRAQDPSSFNTASFSNAYSFGLNGWDIDSSGFAVIGHIVLSGGSITGGSFDSNNNNTLISNHPLSAASNAFSMGSNGRGTLSFPINGTTFHMAVYAISSDEAFLTSITEVSGASVPLAAGEMYVAGTSFSANTLNGVYMIQSTSAENGVPPTATIGLLDFDGAGNVSGTIWQNNGQNVSQPPPISISNGSYSVDASTGRTTFTNTGFISPIFYAFPAVNSPNNGHSAFILSLSNEGDEGDAVFQSSAPTDYSQSSVNGPYAFGDSFEGNNSLTMAEGLASFDGAGDLTSTADTSGDTGLESGVTDLLGSAYTLNPDGTGDFGSTTAIVTNLNHMFFLDLSSSTPSVVVLDQH